MRYAFTLIVTSALIAILAACSTNQQQPDATSIAIATQVAELPTLTPPPTSPPPTRPKRIENLVPLATQAARQQSPTPTVSPTDPPTATPNPAGETPVQQTKVSTPSSNRDNGPLTIPTQTQFNDEVLLQDIYASMDLDRLALPDDYQIPDMKNPANPYRNSFEPQNIGHHPYLHVFPGVNQLFKEWLAQGSPRDDLQYQYRADTRLSGVSFGEKDLAIDPARGIPRFIHYPWFEPFFPSVRSVDISRPIPEFYKYLGYRFGENSTRGVLAEAVTTLLQDAIRPGIRPQAFYHPWRVPKEYHSPDLGDYIRSPIDFAYLGSHSGPRDTHSVPATRWEIIHPELPIVQVTSYSRTILPLTDTPPPLSQLTAEQINNRLNCTEATQRPLEPLTEFAWRSADNQRLLFENARSLMRKHPEQTSDLSYKDVSNLLAALRTTYAAQDKDIRATVAHLDENTRSFFLDLIDVNLDELISLPHTETHFAISFVISFQHRWESFTDPNRWIIRFQDDLLPENNYYLGLDFHTLSPRLGSIDPDVHDRFPYYWHTTDYMQHRIIGPVVLNVFESEVLEPGVYSMTPRIDHWPAPGYIVKDDRALFAPRTIFRKDFDKQNRPLITKPLGISENHLQRLLNSKGRELGALRSHEFGDLDNQGRTFTFGRLPERTWGLSPNYPLPGGILMTPQTDGSTLTRWGLDNHNW